MQIELTRVEDFSIDGKDPLDQLTQIQWRHLVEVGEYAAGYQTRCKIAYSESGIYLVVDCEDRVVTSTALPDYSDLYLEDVVEVFLWPNEEKLLYFEFEISPFGSELPLLVANTGDQFMGWLPWHYEHDRRVRKAVRVRGGELQQGAEIEGWSVLLFIPFALLKGVIKQPPEPGHSWKGNVCRMDYDGESVAKWSLSPGTGGEFHHYPGFATLIF